MRGLVSSDLAKDATAQASGRRQPVKPWIESDALEAHLAAIGADVETATFARSLREDGIAVIDLGEHAADMCDRAVAQTEGYFQGTIARVQDAWRRQPAVRALATNAKILKMLSTVYGRRAFPFQTLNFQRGSQQDIHSDTIHFHSEPPGFMCGVWIALEDIEPDSGPLSYYPTSHKLPVLTMRGAGVNHDKVKPSDYNDYYLGAVARRLADNNLKPRQALLKKGQALVWVANLAHGGEAIARQGATRRSLVVHYYFDNCMYYTPLHSDVESERYHVRLAPDVKSGWWVWPKRNGRPVSVPGGRLASHLWETLSRKVYVF